MTALLSRSQLGCRPRNQSPFSHLSCPRRSLFSLFVTELGLLCISSPLCLPRCFGLPDAIRCPHRHPPGSLSPPWGLFAPFVSEGHVGTALLPGARVWRLMAWGQKTEKSRYGESEPWASRSPFPESLWELPPRFSPEHSLHRACQVARAALPSGRGPSVSPSCLFPKRLWALPDANSCLLGVALPDVTWPPPYLGPAGFTPPARNFKGN